MKSGRQVDSGELRVDPDSRCRGQLISDCWDKIGVNGDSSCAELEKFVHCRNCPVYSAAGTRLLDRELPARYRREWTERYSKAECGIGSAPTRSRGVSVVIFRIGAEWLALPAQVFLEVVEHRSIHSLPHRRQGIVLGLTNIRGELLICVSVGRLLGLDSANAKGQSLKSTPTRNRRSLEPSPRGVAGLAPEGEAFSVSRLLVAQWNNSRLVFPVDEVQGIQRYRPEELTEVPATLAKNAANYSRGILTWRNKSVGCLDEELLFYTLNRSLT
ncbi:MAG: chemotaxis protein CheW [Verrucomicrobia bacterium]|nr:chemotaxis protein CheW [Verrucomicrobiota bacterium]